MMRSGMNRRDFLQAGVRNVGAVGLLSTGSSLPFARPTRAASPKLGGTIRIGQSGGSVSDSLDPASFASGPIVTAMLAVCNNLAEIDTDGNAVPELAESFTPSADARVWTVPLRGDARFGDGRAVTAADVIASFNHHRGADSTSGAKALLTQIADIRADGPNTVIFELKSGNADFPFITADYHLIIMPAQPDGSLNWQSGLGTGGYTLEEHDPGVIVRLKRRDDYWKKGRGWFDTAELLTINDLTARQSALLTGEVDVINSVDRHVLHLLESQPNLSLVETTGTAHSAIPMFCDTPPFDDVNVRLALKHAIGRTELLEKILLGHGALGNDHPIAPTNRFHAADLEQRTYDPDKARYFLKKAGHTRLELTLSAADAAGTGSVDMAVLFREHAAAVGIDIDLVREPDDGYWTNVWLKKPFILSYWNGRPTEDLMFSTVYAGGAEWNESHWRNDRFDALLSAARTELNEDLRREMYREMQILCRDDGGTIVPMFLNYIDARNDRVAHGPVASDRFLDGWKLIERWWSTA